MSDDPGYQRMPQGVAMRESRTFQGGIEWLRERGIEVIDLDSEECVERPGPFFRANPEAWDEDTGETPEDGAGPAA